MKIKVKRFELERRFPKDFRWLFIYGRRKTGKTFFVENFIKFDEYYFIKRSGEVIYDGKIISRDILLDRIEREMGKTLVIDEFHRLGEDFLDFLHAISRKETSKLILISSTLWLSKKLLSSQSPLLGLVYEFPVGLINELDILLNLRNFVKGKELIEAGTYLQEPILIRPFVAPTRDFLANFFANNRYVFPSLVGEIFEEEERRLTKTYKCILEAISLGKNSIGEISSYLYARRLIKKDDPSLITSNLQVLEKIGLIERIPLFGKKRRFAFRSVSRALDLFFYLFKYGYPEVELNLDFIRQVVDQKLPKHVELFFEKLLAELFGLKPVKVTKPELEVDICLLRFQKPALVAEVKWKESLSKEELRKAEEKLLRFKEARKLLILPYEPDIEVRVEVLSPENLLELLRAEL